jgi:hypothetical protein
MLTSEKGEMGETNFWFMSPPSQSAHAFLLDENCVASRMKTRLSAALTRSYQLF